MKSKIICALVAIALSLGLSMAQKKVNLVFIGNSITYGAQIDHDTQAPPVRVGERLKAKGYEVEMRNCGVSGSVTADWLPRFNTWMFQRMVKAADELSQLDGTMVFSIMLGTNDSSIECRVSPSQYYANMKEIVDYLIAHYPKAMIVVNYPIWYSSHTYNGARYLHEGQDRLKTYLPVIDKLCNYYRTSGYNQVCQGSRHTYSYFENRSDLFVAENSALGQSLKFYLHPNAEGAWRLSKFWTRSILKAVK